MMSKKTVLKLSILLLISLTHIPVFAALSKQQQIDLHQAFILEAIKSTPTNCALLSEHAGKLEKLTTKLPNKLYYFRADCANTQKEFLSAYRDLNTFFKNAPKKDDVYAKALILYGTVEPIAKQDEKELADAINHYKQGLCLIKPGNDCNKYDRKKGFLLLKKAVSSELFKKHDYKSFDHALYSIAKNSWFIKENDENFSIFKQLADNDNSPHALQSSYEVGHRYASWKKREDAAYYLNKVLNHNELTPSLKIRALYYLGLNSTTERDQNRYFGAAKAVNVDAPTDKIYQAHALKRMGDIMKNFYSRSNQQAAYTGARDYYQQADQIYIETIEYRGGKLSYEIVGNRKALEELEQLYRANNP